MSDIKLFKMLSGDEFLAKVIATDEDSYVVEDIMAIILNPTSDGRISMAFSPFMPYAQGSIDVMKHAVAILADPTDGLKGEHMRVFSNIVVAPASALK